MASFKGIKERINSVRSTRKITSAMKMVSAAKLHKAQAVIERMLPYSETLHHVMDSLLADGERYATPLAEERKITHVAIVVFSSDSSLCGAFNANITKELQRILDNYRQLGNDHIRIYAVGRKAGDAIRKRGYAIAERFEGLAEKTDYHVIAGLASRLVDQFERHEIDRVELVYHHFRSAGSQVLTQSTLLPLRLPEIDTERRHAVVDYILEPSRRQLLDTLIPKSIKLQLYTALLDSNASEHAARMIAMQTATENADNLLDELTVEYNKSRQQAITSELLDMFGGSAR